MGKIEVEKFKVKLSSFLDVVTFNSVCLKFSECITGENGNHCFTCKSLDELRKFAYGKTIIVSINTEDKRLTDEFEYHIKHWLVEKVGE